MRRQAEPVRRPRGRSRPTRRPHGLTPRGPSRLLQDHARALDAALARLKHHPIGTVLTIAVIGIVLALPAALATLLQDVSGSAYALGQRSSQMTLYLKDSVSTTDGKALAQRIGDRKGVASVKYLSRSAALEEFRQHSNAASALDLLKHNPLPASITVVPDVQAGKDATHALLAKLGELKQVDKAQLNQAWLDRLYAMAHLASHVVLAVMIVLAATVLIVIGNTVRLEIEDRRDEIAITKRIGAPNGWVRRPFLYSGVCYGLGGAIVAWIVVEIGLAALGAGAQDVARLYGTSITLPGLSFNASAMLLGAGLAMGWIAAFWTVSRHLHKIEPH